MAIKKEFEIVSRRNLTTDREWLHHSVPNFNIQIYKDNLTEFQIRELLNRGTQEALELLASYPDPWVRIACLHRIKRGGLGPPSEIFWNTYFSEDNLDNCFTRYGYLAEQAVTLCDDLPTKFLTEFMFSNDPYLREKALEIFKRRTNEQNNLRQEPCTRQG